MTATESTTIEPSPLRVGVVGVGAMGANHARVYSEIREADLVGVADLDNAAAERVAGEYGTEVVPVEVLARRCDAVTVAVPTPAHETVVRDCLDAGAHVLVEKPIADDPARARALADRAREDGLVLQVGHIERFNPAVQALTEIVEGIDVIAIEAERLGPPVDREGSDPVTADLMIHDIDVVNSLLGGEPDSIAATGTEDGQYATATMEYPGGVVASLTASRITRKKIRRLTITAAECLIEVDYVDQSVLIHRESFPEYVTVDGTNRYRHESVIERPRIANREPLRVELESFLAAASSGLVPEVTAEDGIRALETVRRIDRLIGESEGIEVRAG